MWVRPIMQKKKAFILKDVQGRKSGSVKGMKAEARARGGCKFVIGAAGEDKSKDRSSARKMSQAGAVAGAELRQSTVPSMDKDFQFAAVDDSEMGQVRRGGAGGKHGASAVAGEELTQIRLAKPVQSRDGDLRFAAVADSDMVQGYSGEHGARSDFEASTMSWDCGMAGDGSGNGEGFQGDCSDIGSLSVESRGCVDQCADLMVLEGRSDGGSAH